MSVLKSCIGKTSRHSIDNTFIVWVHCTMAAHSDTIYTQLPQVTELRQSSACILAQIFQSQQKYINVLQAVSNSERE